VPAGPARAPALLEARQPALCAQRRRLGDPVGLGRCEAEAAQRRVQAVAVAEDERLEGVLASLPGEGNELVVGPVDGGRHHSPWSRRSESHHEPLRHRREERG